MMSMAFQSSTIKPSSAVPCLCSVLLLLVLTMCSLPSCSHAKSRCKCPGSDSRGARNTMSSTFTTTFDEIYGDLYSTNSSGIIQYLPGDLGYYMKGHYSELSLSDTGLFIMDDQRIHLWVYDDGVAYDPSFSIVFNMSLYQPNDSDSDDAGTLIFAIIPIAAYQNGSTSLSLIDLSSCTNIVDQWGVLIGISNTSITIQAGILDWEFKSANDTIICVKIRILPIEHGVPVSPSSDYRITIAYPLDSNMSIQVELDPPHAQPSSYGSSVNTSMHINISHTISSPFAMFSFCSSMGQLLQLHTFTSTVGLPPWEHPQEKKGASTSTIVLSVLGSAAATAVTAAAVAYWYFNSKYRGWKKDLDQLAKSMQQLPVVPTQFDFADIKKATNNFHETIRLGQGGFGTVYRCRLRALEVAVKKFSRDNNRRYGDFLTEVSVINRLRHRNIVPLVGWSYHKGEPLLIYEFMPNGSLEQHLFPRSSSTMLQQATPMHRWTTRYNMVKDIATGLYYVHHEYEPMVLHRDIKASNVMIDSTFQARLGDFGLACVVANGKNSYTDLGAPGTIGFMAPEYIYSGKATAKSDVFAFGVLVLEIVTGKTAVKNPHFSHITDWVWQHHKEDKLLEAVDPIQRTNEEFEAGDAKRLLLLGLACSNPRPSERPTMVEAVQIIARSAQPPDVPLEIPRFQWPPPEEGCSLSSGYSTEMSNLDRGLSMQVEMAAGGGQASSSSGNGRNSLHQSPIGGPSQEVSSIYHTAPASHRRVFTQEFSSRRYLIYV